MHRLFYVLSLFVFMVACDEVPQGAPPSNEPAQPTRNQEQAAMPLNPANLLSQDMVMELTQLDSLREAEVDWLQRTDSLSQVACTYAWDSARKEVQLVVAFGEALAPAQRAKTYFQRLQADLLTQQQDRYKDRYIKPNRRQQVQKIEVEGLPAVWQPAKSSYESGFLAWAKDEQFFKLYVRVDQDRFAEAHIVFAKRIAKKLLSTNQN